MGILLDQVYKHATIFKSNIIYSLSFSLQKKDMILLGGSRGLTGYDSRLFERKCKRKVFNLCTDDTQLPVQLMQLKMMIHRRIVPGVILLDLLSTDGFSRNSLRFMPLIGDPDVDNYLLHYNGSAWLVAQKILPLFKYAYFNDELLYPIPMILTHKGYQYRSNEIGDYAYPNVTTGLKTSPPDTLFLKQSPTYDSFKSICNEYHIKLVTVIAPIYNTIVITKYPEIINMAPIFNSTPKLFYDNLHLNQDGRRIYDNLIIDSLGKILSNSP